jgi:hypothetical protein
MPLIDVEIDLKGKKTIQIQVPVLIVLYIPLYEPEYED